MTEEFTLFYVFVSGSNTHNNKGQGNDGEGKEGMYDTQLVFQP